MPLIIYPCLNVADLLSAMHKVAGSDSVSLYALVSQSVELFKDIVLRDTESAFSKLDLYIKAYDQTYGKIHNAVKGRSAPLIPKCDQCISSFITVLISDERLQAQKSKSDFTYFSTCRSGRCSKLYTSNVWEKIISEFMHVF